MRGLPENPIETRLRKHHRRVLQLPSHAASGPEDPARQADEVAVRQALQAQFLTHVACAALAGDVVLGRRHPPLGELRKIDDPALAGFLDQAP